MIIQPQTIYTSRITYKGKGRIDITRKGKSIFGPSWSILQPVLHARHHIQELKLEYEICVEQDCIQGCQNTAYELDCYEKELEKVWGIYCANYREEMAEVWRKNRTAFEEMIEKARQTSLVLVCFCMNKDQCHRTLLKDILIACAPRFQTVLYDGGEIS